MTVISVYVLALHGSQIALNSLARPEQLRMSGDLTAMLGEWYSVLPLKIILLDNNEKNHVVMVMTDGLILQFP